MKVVFVGQNIIGGVVLKKLLSAGIIPELVITRNDNNYLNEVCEAAKNIQQRVYKCDNINRDNELIKKITASNPDIIFCAAWPNRIKDILLEIPTIGWINLHPSFLPAYRGSSPITWVLKNGEKQTGATAHFMTKGFDEGNIICQKPVWISSMDNAETLRKKCAFALGEMAIKSYYLLIEDPNFMGTKQDENKASYYPPRENDLIINEDWNIQEALNNIRSLSPYPCAKVIFENCEYRVARVKDVSSKSFGKFPNKNVYTLEGKIYIKLKNGIVKVTAIRENNKINKDYKVV